MKNLLIYTSPNKKFDQETATLAKIQIDNTFDLGWRKQDVLLVTDFPFEYNGVKSLVIDQDVYYDFDLAASKIPVVLYLLKYGIIEKDELYWCHDFDAYELHQISPTGVDLEGVDLGLVHYFYKPEWALSNFFFKIGSFDIIELLHNTILSRPWKSRNNEKTLTWLIKHNKIDSKRYKKLNVTYNIAKRFLQITYKEAEKPIKVLHFRPSDPKDERMPDSALNMFMYGKNRLRMPLMTDRLIKIFNYHGIK